MITFGIHATARAARFEALEPTRQGRRRHFGGVARNGARNSQYMSDHVQKELAFIQTA